MCPVDGVCLFFAQLVTSWMICNRSITVEFFSLKNVNEGERKALRKFNASNLIFFLLVIIWFLLSWKTLFQKNVKFPYNINEQELKRDKSQLWNVDLYTTRKEGLDLQDRKSWKTLFDIGGQVVVDIYPNYVMPSWSVYIALNRMLCMNFYSPLWLLISGPCTK